MKNDTTLLGFLFAAAVLIVAGIAGVIICLTTGFRDLMYAFMMLVPVYFFIFHLVTRRNNGKHQ